MIIVEVKDGEKIERAVKRFRKRFKKAGVLQEYRNKRYYTKPSVERKERKERAAYKNRYLLSQEE